VLAIWALISWSVIAINPASDFGFGLSVIGFMLAFAFSQMLAISSGNLEKPPQFWHDVDEPILT